MNQAKQFWDKQTSSLHRSNSQKFYEEKAEEHAQLMSALHRQAGCIDIGCGAGELLQFFSDQVNVKIGLDFSDSMLKQAEQALQLKPSISLINANIFDYLPNATEAVWTATGSVNQYLTTYETDAFLDMFLANSQVKALYLFDCVDSLRYSILNFGIGYQSNVSLSNSTLRSLVRFGRKLFSRAKLGLSITFGMIPVSQALGSVGMGYGHLPIFWIEAARARGLDINIVSSRYYEYRYHVMLTKNSNSHG